MVFLPLEDGSIGLRIFRVVAIVIVVIIVQVIARKYIEYAVRHAVRRQKHGSAPEEQKREKTLVSLFRKTFAFGLWIVGGAIILQEASINLAALAAGFGVVGVVVGFGAQNVIKDVLNGALIILENQYRIGDIITVGTQSGVVEDITIRLTKLRDLDGSVYFIPNGSITSVQNRTLEFSSVLIDVTVSYDTDVNKAEEVINKVGLAMAEDDDWSDKILEPIAYLRLDSFVEYGVSLKLLGKVTPASQWEVAGEYRRRLKKAFEHAGIEIPLPQLVSYESKLGRKTG